MTYELFKQAAAESMESQGAGKETIQAFFKQAEDLHAVFSTAVDRIAKNDPTFREKAAYEVVVAIEMQKAAEGEAPGMGFGGELMDLFNRIGGSDIGKTIGNSGIGKALGGLGGEGGIGGMLAGGGAGAIGGLLLHSLFNIPLPMAMLLGTLVGGGAGGMLGGTQSGQNMLVNPQPAAGAAAAAAPKTEMPQQQPVSNTAQPPTGQPVAGQPVVPAATQQLNRVTGLDKAPVNTPVTAGKAPQVSAPSTLSPQNAAPGGAAPVTPPAIKPPKAPR